MHDTKEPQAVAASRNLRGLLATAKAEPSGGKDADKPGVVETTGNADGEDELEGVMLRRGDRFCRAGLRVPAPFCSVNFPRGL